MNNKPFAMLRFVSLKIVVNAIVAILQQNLLVPVWELARQVRLCSNYLQAESPDDCNRRL
jgi:hypothetical protein